MIGNNAGQGQQAAGGKKGKKFVTNELASIIAMRASPLAVFNLGRYACACACVCAWYVHAHGIGMCIASHVHCMCIACACMCIAYACAYAWHVHDGMCRRPAWPLTVTSVNERIVLASGGDDAW